MKRIYGIAINIFITIFIRIVFCVKYPLLFRYSWQGISCRQILVISSIYFPVTPMSWTIVSSESKQFFVFVSTSQNSLRFEFFTCFQDFCWIAFVRKFGCTFSITMPIFSDDFVNRNFLTNKYNTLPVSVKFCFTVTNIELKGAVTGPFFLHLRSFVCEGT